MGRRRLGTAVSECLREDLSEPGQTHKRYPTPEYLWARAVPGNVKTEGEMEAVTVGSQLIVKVLLDGSDERAIWT